jgi:arsenite methyltransferase
MDIDSIVMSEYSKALSNESEYLANERQTLCTAEQYDKEFLKKIPKMILDNDFGCGNPSRYVRAGEAVLDLGSGSGKICYILSQIVGPTGKVFGVDVNPSMLELARSQQEEFADTIGFDNMQFCHANITDMKTDLDKIDALLSRGAIDSLEKFQAFERRKNEIFNANPMIPDNSIDVVVSNCVINLVRTGAKVNVFHEMFRVLRHGGRIAISDNTSNIPVPEHLKNDPKLWTACYSGVFQEQQFYRALESAGFEGIRIESRNEAPAKVVDGVEIRSVTVTAVKPYTASSAGTGERDVLYRGPWLEVMDENGIRLRRGEVTQVVGTLVAKYKTETFDKELFILDSNAPQAESSCCAPTESTNPGSACCG